MTTATSDDRTANTRTTADLFLLSPNHNDITTNDRVQDDRQKDDQAIDAGDNDKKEKANADGGHDDHDTAA